MTGAAMQTDVLRALGAQVDSYLEVGVREGDSLAAVLAERTGPVTRVVLCDNWGADSGGTGRGSHDHIVARFPHQECFFLDGDSRVTLAALEGTFDLVHIDGGHTYPIVASDLGHGWRLCGRWLVVHDICLPDVWRALFEFVQAMEPPRVTCYFGGHGTAVVDR